MKFSKLYAAAAVLLLGSGIAFSQPLKLNLSGYDLLVNETEEVIEKGTKELTVKNGNLSVYGTTCNVNGLKVSFKKEKATALNSISALAEGETSGILGTISAVKISKDGISADIKINVKDSEWIFTDVSIANKKGKADISYELEDASGFSFDHQGFHFTAKTLEYDGKEIKTDGTFSKVNNLNQDIQIEEIAIDEKGIRGGEVVKNKKLGPLTYTVGTWPLEFDELDFNDNGLTGDAVLKIDDRKVKMDITLEGFEIHSDGSYEKGRLAAKKEFNYAGFSFDFSDIEFEEKKSDKTTQYNLILKNAKAVNEKSRASVNAGDITVYNGKKKAKDKNLWIVNIDGSKRFQDFVSTNGYNVHIDSFSCTENAFTIKGSIGLGNSLIFKSQSILLDSSLNASCQEGQDLNKAFSYGFQGWTILCQGIQFEKDGAKVSSAKITWREKPYDIGSLKIKADSKNKGSWTLESDKACTKDQEVNFFGNSSYISKLSLDDSGINAEIKYVPSEILFDEITEKGIILKSDNSFSFNTKKQEKIKNCKVKKDKFTVTYGSLSLDEKGLFADDVTFTLPKCNGMKDFKVELKSGFIVKEDSVIAFPSGNVSVSPIKIGTLLFKTDSRSKISLNANKKNVSLSLEGSMELPSAISSLPEKIDGVSMTVNFTEGAITAFSGKSPKNKNEKLELSKNWTFDYENLEFGIDKASLRPSFMVTGFKMCRKAENAKDLSMTLVYDFIADEFVAEKAQSPLKESWIANGITYNLSWASLQKGILTFKGNAKTEDSFPVSFMKGRSFTLSDFSEITDASGSCSIALSTENLAELDCIFPESVLDEGIDSTKNFIQNVSDKGFEIVLDGEILLEIPLEKKDGNLYILTKSSDKRKAEIRIKPYIQTKK